MHTYKVGDSVVHWIYGIGKITAIADKGFPGHPCFYYVIEGDDKTLWVPVNENGRSSLHLITSRSNFKLLINILRSHGEKISNNPYQRQAQLEARMLKAFPKDLCLVIRDLTYRSHRTKLRDNDFKVLKQAKSFFLDEWELSLGTPRENARIELEWILKEIPSRKNTF